MYVIVLAGNAPLPGHWVLERSLDGISYSPWQYFVQQESDCQKLYGISLPQRNIKDDTVKCTDRYSNVVPLTDGQVAVDLVFCLLLLSATFFSSDVHFTR